MSLTAAGCDYSTHAIHLALVSRDAVVRTSAVNLDGLNPGQQVGAIGYELRELAGAMERPFLLLEKPYLGHDNPATALTLAALMGMIQTLALESGFYVRQMLAAEWRPLAGSVLQTQGPAGRRLRKDLKAEALALVRLKHGLITTDDNLAEAVLMAGVALGLAAQLQAVAS